MSRAAGTERVLTGRGTQAGPGAPRPPAPSRTLPSAASAAHPGDTAPPSSGTGARSPSLAATPRVTGAGLTQGHSTLQPGFSLPRALRTQLPTRTKSHHTPGPGSSGKPSLISPCALTSVHTSEWVSHDHLGCGPNTAPGPQLEGKQMTKGAREGRPPCEIPQEPPPQTLRDRVCYSDLTKSETSSARTGEA